MRVGGLLGANELRVDPTAVSAAADRIDAAADGLRAAHAAVHERIAAAQAGWVGTSAAALSGATAKWQEQSAASYTEMIEHATDYRTAAASYTSTDEGEAADVEAKAAVMGL
ncbi:WXG100 family type VII secretion target [Mycolicibacterium alvei]|nr:WXG100 family type VII secretion target [Mycolicibacterium alvei]MCV7002168.1 WXG100 family type VII secretion target [Mycolicibacterium alvei]